MRSMEVVTALLATVMCVKNEAFACHLISAGKEEE